MEEKEPALSSRRASYDEVRIPRFICPERSLLSSQTLANPKSTIALMPATSAIIQQLYPSLDVRHIYAQSFELIWFIFLNFFAPIGQVHQLSQF